MDLGRERAERSGGDRAGEDHRAHDQMVGESGVDPAGPLADVRDRGDVGVDVGLDLHLGQIVECASGETDVGVGDIDGEQPADVGEIGGDRALPR